MLYSSSFGSVSATFDTIDHDILVDRLERWVEISGIGLDWFRSYHVADIPQ
jgi:hypothetical protein